MVALQPGRADNIGRVQRLMAFATCHFPPTIFTERPPTVLDVGSGVSVFLHQMRSAGWQGTGLDPDPRAVHYARQRPGTPAGCKDCMTQQGLGRFDVVAFNEVLEHFIDPVPILARSAQHLRNGGFVYLELPDGEMAISAGPHRQEFFFDHWHVFSATSLAILATRAGFRLQSLERLHEPGGKYILCAFLVPVAAATGGYGTGAEQPGDMAPAPALSALRG
jgi:SAM-dependent methyltransferase